MDKLGFVLLVFSFACFVIAAFWTEQHRSKLVAIGLSFLTAAMIFGNAGTVFK